MNHLQYESSPYLLQHAHNPVEWYAWKPEALEKARRENKPILVSIGYSTCHWCHVMERESFENPDIAAFMNEHFVNIKVDREERPDVDAIYMEACQILTGSGGWPLNCFLTPDGRPFYAGTYYPPRPAYNRPSWLQVLQHLSNAWASQRDAVFEQADKLMNYIRRNDDVLISYPELNPAPAGSAPFGPTGPGGCLETIFYQMRERFDRVEGGFGGAPKFPSTMAIQYLLSYYWFTGQTEALEHALLSLDKMIQGGIYDQLGGGFARYATDRAWLAPHFEKMLYDNALLVIVLSDAVKLLQSDPLLAQQYAARLDTYRETVEETLNYVAREMTHPEGVFYSAQDADSEGVEGKFFVWDKAEIDAILGPDGSLFCDFYGVTEEGNWEHRNILWRSKGDFQEYAAANALDLNELKSRLAVCRQELFRIRSARIWPGLDDKVLLSWNALMVSAYAAAYTALGKEAYKTAATKALDFIMTCFDDGGGALRHTWKDGTAQYAALLDDYAFLIAALIDNYQITFDSNYLAAAGRYMEYVFCHFPDVDSGMFYFTGDAQSDVIVRKKDMYDNATPSGNSTMVHNLQRLGILLDRRDWRAHATGMLQRMQPTLEKYPLSFERWACALLQESYGLHEIGIVGGNAFEKAPVIQSMFLPNKVIAASRRADGLPLLAGKAPAEDAMIYVCRDYACQKPVTSLEEFKQLVQPR
jgi:uncharacterized protein YyaL (SSP411 family)